MTLELAHAALRLARGQTLKLRDSAGHTICASEGAVWITEENRRQDVILQPGGCYRVESQGLTVVQAFAASSVVLN
ncbi:MAG: DUF2917 domain-containing protein [Proteobacteria bacterium]|nr:DUF2917 domain-containing protein [Pseudomonadota bacterium]MDA0982784.1 DUF2917 domain-containing protein [Pseudomonadota bacterium]